MTRALVILFALLVIPGLVKAQEYIIGPEDVLEVRVHDNDDLNRIVSVSLAGYVSLPLIGKVRAGGLTARQLELRLGQFYADGYLRNPQVSVFIKQYKSKKVYVLGAVKQPGSYALTKKTTLLELISAAQGVSADAGLEVTVVRPSPNRQVKGPTTPEQAGKDELIVVDLRALLDGDLARNILVRDEDTVLVSYMLDRAVYVLGQVRKPGKHPLDRDSTVMEMISKAGGITEEAGLDVMVVRPLPSNKRSGPLTPEQAAREEVAVIDLKALMDRKLSREVKLINGDTIFVSHMMDKIVYLLGQVTRPGKYPLGLDSTVIDMISKAGGISGQAGQYLHLVRPKRERKIPGPLRPEQASKDEVTVLNLRALLDGDLTKNMPVKHGDTIFIPDTFSKKIYVVGAVRKPGTIPLGPDSRLIEIISKSQGLTEEAGEEALVIRPSGPRKKEGPMSPAEAKSGEISTVDLRAIQKGDLSQNILLKDGDTVFVPRAEVFFVMGEVNKPGRYKLERGTTVLKAVSTAGGLTERANLKKTKLLREVSGVKKEFQVNVNSLVRPQDTIIVPRRFF